MNEKLSTIQKIGGWISTLLLGNTKEIIIRTDERVQGLMKATDELRQSVDNLRMSISDHGSDIKALKVHTRYGVSHSPTVPNDSGKKLLTDAGFFSQYPEIKNEIFALMDAMNLRTLYDYEHGAVEALEKLENHPAMDLLKDYAVNNPDQPLELIFKVASWVIRDEYAEYKKIHK